MQPLDITLPATFDRFLLQETTNQTTQYLTYNKINKDYTKTWRALWKIEKQTTKIGEFFHVRAGHAPPKLVQNFVDMMLSN